MALSRDKILANAKKFKTREVHIPEWADESGDDVVLVRSLSSKEWDAHQASVRILGEQGEEIGVDQNNVSARLLVRCIVDANGNRLLRDEDANALGDLPVAQVVELGNVVMELSGMTDKGQEAVKGNSDAAPSGGESSGSPESTEPSPTSSSNGAVLQSV